MAGLALTNPPQGTAEPCSQGAGTSGKANLRKGRKTPQPNSFRERKRGPKKSEKTAAWSERKRMRGRWLSRSWSRHSHCSHGRSVVEQGYCEQQ